MESKASLATLTPIRDMDRAIKFYTKVLGGKLLERAPGEMKDGWASVKVGTHTIWLVAPPEREKRRFAYTAFLVKDIKRFVSDLVRNGVKFQKGEKSSPESRLDGPIAFESFGASAFFKDSEGNLLMVWQNGPGM